jgi:hypothetical protein
VRPSRSPPILPPIPSVFLVRIERRIFSTPAPNENTLVPDLGTGITRKACPCPLRIFYGNASTESEIDMAFTTVVHERADALVVATLTMLIEDRLLARMLDF